jgi:hypothetical protein
MWARARQALGQGVPTLGQAHEVVPVSGAAVKLAEMSDDVLLNVLVELLFGGTLRAARQ